MYGSTKKPAHHRCNRGHPKSPHQKAIRKRAEAEARNTAYQALPLHEKIARNSRPDKVMSGRFYRRAARGGVK